MKRLAALAFILIPGIALAQPAPPQRVEGTVSALTESSMTIKKADGTSETVALLPGRNINITAPVAVDQIQPGSYVATANKTQPDGSGVSQELRVYPPATGATIGTVNRAMNAEGDLMMTNGTVATAVSADGGRMLTVDYGQGQRKIKVPTTLQVVSNTPGTSDQLKVGTRLSIVTFNGQGGGPGGQIITIARKDLSAQ
jgi:hypothetical protein